MHPSNEQEPFGKGGSVDSSAHDDCNKFAVELVAIVVGVKRGAGADGATPAVAIGMLVAHLDDVQPSHRQ